MLDTNDISKFFAWLTCSIGSASLFFSNFIANLGENHEAYTVILMGLSFFVQIYFVRKKDLREEDRTIETCSFKSECRGKDDIT